MSVPEREDHAVSAIEESEFWEQNKSVLSGRMGYIVGHKFGRPPGSVEIRSKIYRAGPGVAVLWDRIEKGMGLYVANRILKQAMKAGGDLASSIEKELLDYDLNGKEMKSVTGGIFKRRSPKSCRTSASDDLPSIPPPPPTPPSSPGLPRSSWKKIRLAMEELLEGQLKSADKDVTDEIRTAFKAEVQRMVIWLRSRVNAGADMAPMDVILNQGQSRKNVLDWCKSLKVQTPKPGLPVDEEELKRKYRAFARMYHPDRPSGDTEKMAVINDAYNGLCSYNFSLKSDS